MISFARTDTSILGRWWWTVDRWLLGTVAVLMALGTLLILAASPAVAERIGLMPFHFVKRQFLYLVPALGLLIGCSLLSPRAVRRVGCVLFLLCLALIGLTLLIGPEIKGAQRWIPLGGLAMQPSEFMKPAIVIVTAWMFAAERHDPAFPGRRIALGLLLLVGGLLVLQPDLGQTALITVVWLAQLFMAGTGLGPILILGTVGGIGLVLAYFTFPHVADRIDSFFNPATGDTYQIDTALSAFRHGGILGQGLGEGAIKWRLPDAHSDFIFAVMGEEFGLVACLALLGLFAFIVFRGLLYLFDETDHFAFLAVGGLTVLFGLQAVINMGVNLELLPSKGMTLPFISYGGSSLLAMSITLGMVLALTRRHRSGVRRRYAA